jgi:FMN phosphatase YigB (HAD superfamily)
MIAVFDADNTLYDFARFFAFYFRSLVHLSSKATGVDEAEVTLDLKNLYLKHGTIEYQFVIQESALFQGQSPEKLEDTRRLLSIGARQVRQKRLALYDGVKPTLETLRLAGVKCVAVTNAPFYHVVQRFNWLGLHKYFDAMLCAKGAISPSPESVAKDQRKRSLLSARYALFHELPKDLQKPSSTPYRMVREHYGNHDMFVAIGDSINKDLRPAQSEGFKTVWARYGTEIEDQDMNTLLSVTPWTPVEIAVHQGVEFKPDFAVDSLSEIIDLFDIRPLQNDLFG